MDTALKTQRCNIQFHSLLKLIFDLITILIIVCSYPKIVHKLVGSMFLKKLGLSAENWFDISPKSMRPLSDVRLTRNGSSHPRLQVDRRLVYPLRRRGLANVHYNTTVHLRSPNYSLFLDPKVNWMNTLHSTSITDLFLHIIIRSSRLGWSCDAISLSVLNLARNIHSWTLFDRSV